MFKYVYTFLQSNDIVYKNQAKFLSAQSTVFQVIDIYY